MRPSGISLLILDVDGVLTDGGLTMNAAGEWSKTFNVQDGHAIVMWQKLGHRVAILSARKDESVARRAAELGIKWVRMGESNKLAAYSAIVAEADLRDENVCYMADDLPDLGPLSKCGFSVAVGNAVPTIKRVAAYVTRHAGGNGAVAEVIELLLRRQKRWPANAQTD